MKINKKIPAGAFFDEEQKYRYALWRIWDSKLPLINFIGLNPSRANATTDDATIRRLIKYTKDWGYGGFIITNLFAIRSVDPGRILQVKDPVGPDNDKHILQHANTCQDIILMWGNAGIYYRRNISVLENLESSVNGFFKPNCFGITKDGHPMHPLYLSSDVKPIKYK